MAKRYADGVDALAAGADLLHRHVFVNVAGFREPRSDWAEVLAAGPVVTALAGEVTMWAHHAERLVSRVIDAPVASRQLHRPHLASARGLLVTVARTAFAGPGNPDAVARADVLRAVPALAVPERIVPDGRETDAELCAGISVSAERLRAGSFAMTREPGDSAVLSGPAWRRIAHAAAITCDLAVQVMDGLARMPEGISGIPPRQVTDAVSSFAAARERGGMQRGCGARPRLIPVRRCHGRRSTRRTSP